MMWRNAILFGDDAMAERILAAPHPHEAKALGGRVAGFDQSTWDEHRFPIVVAGNQAKLSSIPRCAFLLDTGQRILAEASPVDRIWGIGLTRDHPAAFHPAHWPGTNLLGFALMHVRDALQGQLQR